MKRIILLFLVLVLFLMMGCDNDTRLPILWIHGPSGSASQFESQAQRFMANGYPLEYLHTLEYDSSVLINAMTDPTGFDEIINDPEFQERVGTKIDQILADTGAEKVNLIGLSVTSYMCNAFLKAGDNAQKVAHFAQTDGYMSLGLTKPYGGVDALALWSGLLPNANSFGRNVTNHHDDTLAHVEVATSALSFEKIYEFFNGEAPKTTDIPKARRKMIRIAGKANVFPYNEGADDTILSIYEVDQSTGLRVEDADPIVEDLEIDADGDWGPFKIKKGATYEFVLANEVLPEDKVYFYREPFYADDYFIRLNVGRTGEGISSHLNRDAAHTNLVIARDREMWGDADEGNDQVFINDDEVNVLTPEAATEERMLTSLFISDQDANQESDYKNIDENITQSAFIAGIDYYIPAATQADLSDLSTISVKMIARGGDGTVQTINVPNWPADQVRTVSVQFRDFVQ